MNPEILYIYIYIFLKDSGRVSGTQRFIGTIQTQRASLVKRGKGICSGLQAVFTRLKRDFNHHMTSRGNGGQMIPGSLGIPSCTNSRTVTETPLGAQD